MHCERNVSSIFFDTDSRPNVNGTDSVWQLILRLRSSNLDSSFTINLVCGTDRLSVVADRRAVDLYRILN